MKIKMDSPCAMIECFQQCHVCEIYIKFKIAINSANAFKILLLN